MKLNPFHKYFLTSKGSPRRAEIMRRQAIKTMQELGDQFFCVNSGDYGECARLCQKHGTDKPTAPG